MYITGQGRGHKLVPSLICHRALLFNFLHLLPPITSSRFLLLKRAEYPQDILDILCLGDSHAKYLHNICFYPSGEIK